MAFEEYNTEELRVLVNEASAELRARDMIAEAESRMDDLNRLYLNGSGRVAGDPWVQPLGAHDAYPTGWTVTHNDKEWVNTIFANVFEPGVTGWDELVVEGAVPEWIQPLGAHDAYNTGERVLFEAQVWESLIDANIWSPTAYPAGWTLVEA